MRDALSFNHISTATVTAIRLKCCLWRTRVQLCWNENRTELTAYRADAGILSLPQSPERIYPADGQAPTTAQGSSPGTADHCLWAYLGLIPVYLILEDKRTLSRWTRLIGALNWRRRHHDCHGDGMARVPLHVTGCHARLTFPLSERRADSGSGDETESGMVPDAEGTVNFWDT